mgnify:CR=1 FL=1
MVNWDRIAGKIDSSLKIFGGVDHPDGFPIVLRKSASGASSVPGEPPSGSPTYTTLRGVSSVERMRDKDGTLIGETVQTIVVSAVLDAVPEKGDAICVGITDADVVDTSVFVEIDEVRAAKPANIALAYEIDIIGGVTG